MLYCKDCSFYRASIKGQPVPSGKCNHPSAICDTDSVWGYDVFYSAQAMRMSDRACGKEANWFKPTTY